MKKTRFIITFLIAMFMCIISASALELDVAEGAYDMSVANENAALASELDIPTYDPYYGELVWYNNFEESLTTPVYCAGTSGSGANGGYGTCTVDTSPDGNGKALRVNSTSASNSGYVAKISGFEKTGLTVTLVADYYFPTDTTVTSKVWYRFSGFGGKWDLTTNESPKDKWNTVAYSASTTATLKEAEFRNNAGVDGVYYLDNARIYVKYALPENEIRLVDGSSVSKVTVDGEYTFGASSDPSAQFTVWMSDDGTSRYVEGQTVSASEIGGKTFVAVAIEFSLIDEEKGALILFHGYEGADYRTIEYFDTEYMTSVSWSKGSGLAFNTFAHVTDATDSSNKVLEMTLNDGASYKISGFQYDFDGLEFMPGEFTQVLDVYNRNEGSSLHRETQHKTDSNENFGAYSRWQDITFTPNTWVRNLEMEKLYVAENTDLSTKDTYKYEFGYDLTQGHTKVPGNTLTYLQYRFNDSGKTSVTVDNYRLYFYPANAFMVKDGTSLVMETGAENGTYTFKAPSEVFGGEYGANVCYTDGASKYFAGQTVDIARIAGKTLTLNEATPVNSGNAEIRVSNSAETTGIRFKASITPSLKAVSNEYGFIVAREDVLESLDAELTFGLNKEGLANGEGVLFVRGVAYKTDENGNVVTDKIYSDNEDGSMNFTGVAVGFDISVKKQVTTKLTARPYVIIKNANGNEFVAYGESYSESLAGVAQVLKDAADGENADALDAYKSADYQGGNFIDDILASAGN